MNPATFILKHPESRSRAFIEFVLDKHGKVRIASVAFARGNVVSLVAIRERIPLAYEYLTKGTV